MPGVLSKQGNGLVRCSISHFDFPTHRDRAVALGRLVVNGAAFLLQPWREADHGSIATFTLHVRVVIERMPLHLWSIEGAEQVLGKDVIVDRLDSRTYAKEDTKFSPSSAPAPVGSRK